MKFAGALNLTSKRRSSELQLDFARPEFYSVNQLLLCFWSLGGNEGAADKNGTRAAAQGFVLF